MDAPEVPPKDRLSKQPRDERLRIPQGRITNERQSGSSKDGSPTRTGLRKRGQTQCQPGSVSTLGDQPYYSRSIISMRSEMTLGILDLYLDDDEPIVDPAMQSFDFDLSLQKDDRTVLPSYKVNFFRKALPKLSTPPKRRLGLPYLQRRRSSLSICCCGEEIEVPDLSFSCKSADSSPISLRNVTPEHDVPTRDSVSSPLRQSKAPMMLFGQTRNRARNDSFQSTVSSTSHHKVPSVGSSFDFVRSARRRPVPLREAPPSLQHRGVKQLGKKLASGLRRAFSFQRRRLE